MWSPGVYIVYLPTQLVTQQDTDQEGDHKNQQSQKGISPTPTYIYSTTNTAQYPSQLNL